MTLPIVLALRPGALGDTLLTVPALRALRRRFPHHQLVVAGEGAAVDLLVRCREISSGLRFDDGRLAWLFGGEPPDPVPDVVIGWFNDSDGRLEGRLRDLGVREMRIAPSQPGDEQTHCAKWLLSTVLEQDPGFKPEEYQICVPDSPSTEVFIHPGSGSVRKNWPSDRFAEVAGALIERGVRVSLVAGEADDKAVAAVLRQTQAPVPVVRETVTDLAARLAGARAYLGNDSGVSHLAGLVGARTVTLFGTTSPAVWSPLGPRVEIAPFSSSTDAIVRMLIGANQTN